MNLITSPKSLYIHAKPDAYDAKLGRDFQKRILAITPIQGNTKLIDAMAKRRPRPLSRVNTTKRLLALKQRAAMVCSGSALTEAHEFLDGAICALGDEEAQGEMRDLVIAAQNGDKEAQATLALRVVSNVGHLSRATGNWNQWYEQVSLEADETPWIRNYIPQQVNVRVGNSDGTLMTQDAMPNLEDSRMVPLFFLLTDVFAGTRFDMYNGDIADAQLGTVDLALDLAEKKDGLLQLPFTVGTPNSVFTAAFTNDGTTASHYHLSGRIDPANLPAGNIITLSSNSVSTKPRFDVLRAIDQYYSQWGDKFFGEEPMNAIEIRVASGIAHQFGDEFTPQSVTNVYTDKLASNRMALQYNGKTYTITADNTISPTDKHVYVRSNLPAGILFDKPAGSLVHREEHVVQNEFTVFERELMGYGFPVTWAARVLAVKFKS